MRSSSFWKAELEERKGMASDSRAWKALRETRIFENRQRRRHGRELSRWWWLLLYKRIFHVPSFLPLSGSLFHFIRFSNASCQRYHCHRVIQGKDCQCFCHLTRWRNRSCYRWHLSPLRCWDDDVLTKIPVVTVFLRLHWKCTLKSKSKCHLFDKYQLWNAITASEPGQDIVEIIRTIIFYFHLHRCFVFSPIWYPFIVERCTDCKVQKSRYNLCFPIHLRHEKRL